MQNFSDTVNPVIPIVGYHKKSKPLLKDAGRIVKTHESYRREYSKAVWIVRDPRDVVVSEYKLQLRSQTFSGSFADFLVRFTAHDSSGPPNWGQHTDSWITSPIAESDALLRIRFEDMKSDIARELNRVLSFMGLKSNPDVIQRALNQNTLKSMADRHARYDKTLSNRSHLPAVNSGKSGGWRDILTASQVDLIECRFQATMEQLGYGRSTS